MAALQPNAAALRAPSANHPRTAAPVVHFLGPWRLVRLLGEGEWNQVLQAAPIDATTSSSADYAIKRIKASSVNDPLAIRQLRREAQIGRSISHPHLVSVLSAHLDRPPYYLVMPYQRGASLRQVLRKREWLSVSHSLWITRQIAEGMWALHERGWLHNDIKPDNIFISANGHATLCDLGLAQAVADMEENNSPSDDSGRHPISNERFVAGTPAYMPPESFCVRERQTSASDTYRLGVTLFEMLAGRRPFEQTDAEQLAAAHRLLKPPEICAIQPSIPTSVARLINRMLAKEPLRRPTGIELIHSLVDAEIDLFDDGPCA